MSEDLGPLSYEEIKKRQLPIYSMAYCICLPLLREIWNLGDNPTSNPQIYKAIQKIFEAKEDLEKLEKEKIELEARQEW